MIRSGYTLLPSLLFMVGCPAETPSEQVVERIEARLKTDPCLEDLAVMRRTYEFAKRGWKIDLNRIDVSIELAGWDGLPAGIAFRSPRRGFSIDERERFSAAATYVVSTDDLDIWSCGGTWGGLRHEPRF